MIIIINAATINVGGGLFVTVNFIRETLTDKKNTWHYILSKVVQEELNNANIKIDDDKKLVLNHSPADILNRFQTLRDINQRVKIINPSLIYSIGSPSYISFRCVEIQRLTNPYITHLNKHALFTYDFFERLKITLKVFIQRKFLSQSKYFITQTVTAKEGIMNFTPNIQREVAVIPNSLSEVFIDFKKNKAKEDLNYIFCLSADYNHKNLFRIPQLALLLKSKGVKKTKFIITLPSDSKVLKNILLEAKKLDIEEYILNVGKLTQVECAIWYNKSKLVFLPTYLETFSATLIESLFMNVPIVTTDFSFNKDVCGKYAYYFKPNDWEKAAFFIEKILNKYENTSDILMPKEEFYKKFKSFKHSFNQTIGFMTSVLKRIESD